jgi:hypothetical protein
MWDLDRSHYPGGTTPISQWLMGANEIEWPRHRQRVLPTLASPAEPPVPNGTEVRVLPVVLRNRWHHTSLL